MIFVSDILGTTEDNYSKYKLQDILDKIVAYAKNNSDSDEASITLWDRACNVYCGSSCTIINQSKWLSSLSLRKEGASTHKILTTQEHFISADTEQLEFRVNEIIPEFGIRAYLGVPIIHEGKSLGVIYLLDKNPRNYSDEQVNWLLELGLTGGEIISNFDILDCVN